MEVTVLVQKVDNVFSESIKEAKADYDTRISAINDIYDNMPDIVIQAGGVSRRALADGALGEAQKARRAASNKMESVLGEALSEMDAMKNDPSNASSIKLLTEKLTVWVSQFEQLTIPASKHTKAEPYSAPLKVKKALDDWVNFCENDPVILKAELYERKAKLEGTINSLREKITELTDKIEREKSELDDRNSNAAKYEKEVTRQVEIETDNLDTEIRRAKQSVSDIEFHISSSQQQLSGLGAFAFGKKKELKAQIQSAQLSLEDALKNVSSLEEKKKSIQDSLPKKLKELEEKVTLLSEKIRKDENELMQTADELENTQRLLDTVDSDIAMQ